jgi:hypothetical protein
MRIPIASMKQGFDAEWPMEYDTPEEALLVDLWRGKRIDIDFDMVGVEAGKIVLEVFRVEHKRPKLVKK